MNNFEKYINALQNVNFDEATEHSLRFELKNLLDSLLKVENRKIDILHEGKREGKFGSPDFKLSDEKGIVGYIETKKIDENLAKVLKSSQILKYIELSNNILLTNYLEFIWIRNGKVELREKLCTTENLQDKSFQLSDEKIEKVESIFQQFFAEKPVGINNVDILSMFLAKRTKSLKYFLQETLHYQEENQSQSFLLGLLDSFRKNVATELSISEFSDVLAQTLAYGLFWAKLNAEKNQISLYNVSQYIPKSFSLIRELVGFLNKLDEKEYQNTKWIIEEIIAMLNNIDVKAIRKTLSYNQNESDFADPYLYFYEIFLGEYDNKLRKAKGVYYTPTEIVQFIVKVTDELLQKFFKIPEGLGNKKKITVLDFATGTGTFMLEIFKLILQKTSTDFAKTKMIQEHLLKNIFGFEYLIAPYTIAHLKLSQYLADNNYILTDEERLQVYLTNTLEPMKTQYNVFVQALSQEGKMAQEIKEKPILIITGNPPYSASSTNKNAFILNLLNDYKKGLNERSINSLNDDYIKFIRFAHHKIEKEGKGIVAIITNNSYLSGIIHRKMRQKIFEDFDKIFIVNLHGNSLKKEKDKNIFNIRVGVSVLFLIKSDEKIDKEVLYFSTLEHFLMNRSEKFEFFKKTNLENLPFKKLNPCEPNFWFVPTNFSFQKKYDTFWSLRDIFKFFNTAIKTHKDSLTIHFSLENLKRMRYDFLHLKEYYFREKYKIEDSRDWKYESAKKELMEISQPSLVNYRVFDCRYTYYSHKSNRFMTRPSYNLFQHFLAGQNRGIVTTRLLSSESFQHCFVTDKISDACFISNMGSESNYVFPIYLYSEETNGNGLLFEKQEGRKLNFTDKFKLFIKNHFVELVENQDLKSEIFDLENQLEEQKQIFENLLILKSPLAELQKNEIEKLAKIIAAKKENLQISKQTFQPTGEAIFNYIYAILFSSAYREKYFDFLRIDFPKIPFTNDKNLFEKLSKIGETLIESHLFNEIPYLTFGKHFGNAKTEVSQIKFFEEKLFYNETNFFDNVSQEIFDYKIGSYCVLEKFFKERKDKELDFSEIETVEKMINVIDFTLKTVSEINFLTENWV